MVVFHCEPPRVHRVGVREPLRVDEHLPPRAPECHHHPGGRTVGMSARNRTHALEVPTRAARSDRDSSSMLSTAAKGETSGGTGPPDRASRRCAHAAISATTTQCSREDGWSLPSVDQRLYVCPRIRDGARGARTGVRPTTLRSDPMPGLGRTVSALAVPRRAGAAC
jgi:hypothetical protein